jgi:hypothetical protein
MYKSFDSLNLGYCKMIASVFLLMKKPPAQFRQDLSPGTEINHDGLYYLALMNGRASAAGVQANKLIALLQKDYDLEDC